MYFYYLLLLLLLFIYYYYYYYYYYYFIRIKLGVDKPIPSPSWFKQAIYYNII